MESPDINFTHGDFSLSGASTVIMACQSLHLGPAWIWKKADDTTTVLFTVELLVPRSRFHQQLNGMGYRNNNTWVMKKIQPDWDIETPILHP